MKFGTTQHVQESAVHVLLTVLLVTARTLGIQRVVRRVSNEDLSKVMQSRSSPGCFPVLIRVNLLKVLFAFGSCVTLLKQTRVFPFSQVTHPCA